jgi:Ni,Fe-hydrogenase maturation factor
MQALGESVLERCTSIARHEGDTARALNVLPLLQAFPSRVIGCQVGGCGYKLVGEELSRVMQCSYMNCLGIGCNRMQQGNRAQALNC